ncbi:MAG: peptide chain release factor N(5)-glutamine methyltransferase [Deltaproteobacteria bacterium]|uniref:Release factor glutamine methyltransferase n=1 Tax=Candidatus Zymogenus saltonus TaxID=2844893 RepID=A0A9D8KGZ7_9DELT|nr:peptide chain release factor N(5)-glutamine methyltransferase [Candidatus Zymogenus saltonus]
MIPPTGTEPVAKKDLPKEGTPSNILEAVNRASSYLKEMGIESHRLDSELITAKVLDARRIDLYLMHDRPLTPEEWREIGSLILKRGGGAPTAYITGEKEFWSISISVNESVLIPRPETEVLVEETLAVIGGIDEEVVSILEIGTGSGAVAMALSAELPGASITATDISKDAIKVASENLKRHGFSDRVDLLCGSLYEPIILLEKKYDVILSNPPYVSAEQMESLPVEIKREPYIALDGSVNGGADGLDVIRPIIDGAPDYLIAGGHLLLEIGSDQMDGVRKIVEDTPGLSFLKTRMDYASLPRVVVAVRD